MPEPVALLPCPFCGTSDVHADSIYDGEERVFCTHCDTQGPMRRTQAEAIAAWNTRTQTDQPKLERLEAKWLKWPDGDAGDAIDFACDHCAPDEALAFMNDWREGMAGEWPGYVSWLKTQRDGASSSLSSSSLTNG